MRGRRHVGGGLPVLPEHAGRRGEDDGAGGANRGKGYYGIGGGGDLIKWEDTTMTETTLDPETSEVFETSEVLGSSHWMLCI